MTDFNNNFDHELDWNDEITNDGAEFISLQPGDYQFTVTNIERARHTPNPHNPGKLPACNKAIVSVKIETAEGSITLKHNLFLHSTTEGMLSAFFGAIGQKKHGQPLKMNWNVIGATGVCRINKRKGTGQYADREYDNIKSMIYADDVDWTKVLNANQSQAGQQQTVPQQQPMQQQPNQGFQQPANGGFGGF
ncbi:hypothetical protein SMU76_06134 [Streptococcus mutans N66]|uniref:hypothetical protein n=1 Tax=Streptococcus mutans TaxID=1309 RepID=UPI0002B5DE86|nr:hypothetical protein [Streptococcus mutans]EMC14442.1 hypothetical protein SMU76_06134 [Streptococcus mutans N66]